MRSVSAFLVVQTKNERPRAGQGPGAGPRPSPPHAARPDGLARHAIRNYLETWRHHPGYQFVRIRSSPCLRFVEADLLAHHLRSTYDYLDPKARRLCTALAVDLRELAGRNVFFDLQHGTLRIVVPPDDTPP